MLTLVADSCTCDGGTVSPWWLVAMFLAVGSVFWRSNQAPANAGVHRPSLDDDAETQTHEPNRWHRFWARPRRSAEAAGDPRGNSGRVTTIRPVTVGAQRTSSSLAPLGVNARCPSGEDASDDVSTSGRPLQP